MKLPWKRDRRQATAPEQATAPWTGRPPDLDMNDPAVTRQIVGRFFEQAGTPLPGSERFADLTWPGADPFAWYPNLFLTPEDLPGMTLAEDRRRLWAFRGEEEAFPKNGGVICGLTRWAPAPDRAAIAPIGRLIDIRMAFVDRRAAQHWYVSTMEANSEGMPPLGQPAGIGSSCHVFGGNQTLGDFTGEISDFVSFNFLVLVVRVVLKIFAAQGTTPLELSTVEAIAHRGAERAERFVTS
jgi:hypothetical protein